MKIVFVSNFYNHHQAPFCEAMYNRLENDFFFIQTAEMEAERRNMGWGRDSIPLFVKKSYGDPGAESECRSLIENADVVITGSAPECFIENRIRSGKLVLRYSERPLKKGLELWKYPYRYFKWHKKNPSRANVYMLCASAYTSSDYAKFGLFKNRCYKWGYFPVANRYANIDQLIGKKQPASILWCARLIDWKHPELPILVAKRLKEENYSFVMRLIGTGVLEEKIKCMIRDYGLEDYVQMLGTMKPEQVREHMEKSQIFLFTSDRNEGWGAVLNEAMNSACGVVASNAIGATPFLTNGENGLVYKDGDFEALYSNVQLLLNNPERVNDFGKKAYETIVGEWNAETAAERLLCLVTCILNGEDCSSLYITGPCSRV